MLAVLTSALHAGDQVTSRCDCTFATASRLLAPQQQQHGLPMLGLPFSRGCRAVMPPQLTELLSLLQQRCLAAPTCPVEVCKAAWQQG